MDIHVAAHSPVSTSEEYSVNHDRIFVVVLISSLPVFTHLCAIPCLYVPACVKAVHIQWQR